MSRQPPSSQDMLTTARRLTQANDRDQARCVLNELLAADPDNLEAWGLLLRLTDNYREEMVYLRQILARAPDESWVKERLDQLVAYDHGPETHPSWEGDGHTWADEESEWTEVEHPSPAPRHRRFPLWPLIALLVGFCLIAGAAGIFLVRAGNVTQESSVSCEELINTALELSDESCNRIGENQVCYGNIHLEAELNPGAPSSFNMVGDVIGVQNLRSLSASPMDLESHEWGIALFKLEANIAYTSPGQLATFIVFGDTNLTNDSGDMQAFYFSSGFGKIVCEAVPFDGIYVSMPDGSGVSFTANGTDITLFGEGWLEAQRGQMLRVSVVKGSGEVESQPVGAGWAVSVPLDDELNPTGPPSVPEWIVKETLAQSCTLFNIGCESDEFDPVYPGGARGTVVAGSTEAARLAEEAQEPTATLRPGETRPPTDTPTPIPTVRPGDPTYTPTSTPVPTVKPGDPTYTPTSTPVPTVKPGDPTYTPSPPPTSTSTATPTNTSIPTSNQVLFRLISSGGVGLSGGEPKYYKNGWHALPGTTGADGQYLADLPLDVTGSIPLRMVYEGKSLDITQDITANPTVTFTTINVTMRLQTSGGAPLDPGQALFYTTGWRTFGTTSGGQVSKELLPGTYSFRMRYEEKDFDVSQDISANPNITFTTVNVTMRLQTSGGAPLDPGQALFYTTGWRTFGTTSGGQVSKELLPGTYSFRMRLEDKGLDISQDISANPTVVFQTVNVTIQFRDSFGNPLDPGDALFYTSGWRTFGTTSGGQVSKELLPGDYSFRLRYLGANQDTSQNVGSSPTITFQAGQVISDSGTCINFYTDGWKTFTDGMQLLPGSYSFRFNDGTPDTVITINGGTTNHIH